MATIQTDKFSGTPAADATARFTNPRLRYFGQGYFEAMYFRQRYLALRFEGTQTDRMSGTVTASQTDRFTA